MARTEKLKKSWPNLISETYCLLKSSSRKVYSKGRLGMACTHMEVFYYTDDLPLSAPLVKIPADGLIGGMVTEHLYGAFIDDHHPPGICRKSTGKGSAGSRARWKNNRKTIRRVSKPGIV